MAIISQETWDNMPKEEKELIRQDYQRMIDGKTEFTEEEKNGATYQTEWLFGIENLQPKPKIRTWEDVTKINPNYEQDCQNIRMYTNMISNKLKVKLLATYKIAKLIELGYGGKITDEEWRNWDVHKYCYVREGDKVGYSVRYQDYEFIAFHTLQQLEEFTSYPENVELIRQYYMI